MNDRLHDRLSHATKPQIRVDALRERLAAPELTEARTVLDRGGVPALIDLAEERLLQIGEARERFETLSRDIEAKPGDRDALIERYLRETVAEPSELAADLRARRKSGGTYVDLATLGERLVKGNAASERAAEAALALARSAIAEGYAPPVDLGPIFDLARTAGQWSRRTEALGLLGDLARLRIGAEAHDAIGVVAGALTTRSEHRWVQPAALAALAGVDHEGAITIARDRFASPDGGDDFLVRERIVELAARGALGPQAWERLVTLAAADPSEHVRITVARAERDPLRLERLATADASAKVRAAAMISLSTHDPAVAEDLVVSALRKDPAELVVRTAAEEACALARRAGLRDGGATIAALADASARVDLPPTVRTRASDALIEVGVFCDGRARAAYDLLAPIATDTPVGGRSIVKDPFLVGLDDERLGRVLAVLAHGDYALGVDRIDGGIVLHRGERRGFAGWRALYELTHPSPSKRQAFDHTLGRHPAGTLRAPPGGLAELTATRVPGERVLVEEVGGWGRHLPLVDDLLSSASIFRSKPVTLVASTGTTTIVPPKGLGARLKSWVALTTRYAQLSDLRRRALESDEPTTQAAYVNEVARRTSIAIQYTPHTFTAGDLRVATAPPRGIARGARLAIGAAAATNGAAPTAIPNTAGTTRPSQAEAAPPAALGLAAPLVGVDWSGFADLGRDLVAYATSPYGNKLSHLAAYATVTLAAFLVRGVAIRRSIENDREAIPLVIGGWGTRGKSGTERLKAALFQGLGHEVLVKTTGCEAMFIHGIPGQTAREVFIYRPYDKATVWEQRDLLSLARSLGARVFLWECMALQPDLVNLLQAQWMRDDYSTITNAYPDHEDVQGPSGYDVANVISEFVPTKGHLLTSEEQMLPLLRERAKERGSSVRVIGARDADLLADDLLARFPYAEHPRNIALVAGLARALGVPSAVALAEMADHVVPDLGVLKEYPTVPHRGRTLSFVNGMSANERTAALGNWIRTGFEEHDVDRDPKTWLVTVVNNRGDRVARSEVFARFLVEDIAAHRHVLIGTNVAGLRAFIDDALKKHLAAISPTHELAGDGTERLHMARARVDRAFARLKIGQTDADSVLAELAVLGAPALERALIEPLLEPSEPGERYERARAFVEEGIPSDYDPDLRPFVVSAIAKRRTVRAIHAIVGRDLGANPTAIDVAFARAYRAILAESIIAIDDPQATGDQILDAVARAVPPGAHARIMGCQNIKGTGLDFVYRWVSIDTVAKYLGKLGAEAREDREEALRALAIHGDYGLLEARLALGRVEAARDADPQAGSLPYDLALSRLREVVDKRERALSTRRTKSVGETMRSVIGKTFDYLDATRRRRMANELLEALVTGRVSHAAAAKRMREIVARAKGGWLMAAKA